MIIVGPLLNFRSPAVYLVIFDVHFLTDCVLFQVPSAIVSSQLALLSGTYFSLLVNLQAPRRHLYICCQVLSSFKNKKEHTENQKEKKKIELQL